MTSRIVEYEVSTGTFPNQKVVGAFRSDRAHVGTKLLAWAQSTLAPRGHYSAAPTRGGVLLGHSLDWKGIVPIIVSSDGTVSADMDTTLYRLPPKKKKIRNEFLRRTETSAGPGGSAIAGSVFGPRNKREERIFTRVRARVEKEHLLHQTGRVGKKLRACDAAVLVLRETDNPAVMWGDCGLLDLIAARAGTSKAAGRYACEDHPLARHERVMACLSRQPGILVAGKTLVGRSRAVRIFWLPETAPKALK